MMPRPPIQGCCHFCQFMRHRWELQKRFQNASADLHWPLGCILPSFHSGSRTHSQHEAHPSSRRRVWRAEGTKEKGRGAIFWLLCPFVLLLSSSPFSNPPHLPPLLQRWDFASRNVSLSLDRQEPLQVLNQQELSFPSRSVHHTGPTSLCTWTSLF